MCITFGLVCALLCICVLQDEDACDFFAFIDPEYTPRSMEVIDDLVEEQIETRDWILGDRNERYWVKQDDMRVEDGLRVEVMKLKKMLGICVSVVVLLVAVIVMSWMGQVEVV